MRIADFGMKKSLFPMLKSIARIQFDENQNARTSLRLTASAAIIPQSEIRNPKSFSALTCRSAAASIAPSSEPVRSNARAMQIFVKNNMQWFARPLELTGNLSVSRSRPARRTPFRLRSRELPDQSRRHQSAVSRQLASSAFGRTDAGGSIANCRFWFCIRARIWARAKRPGWPRSSNRSIEVFRRIPKVKTKIALETTAGQGSCLGHRFEHLAHIMAQVREPERLCVCLDTAHVFAAGYDITTETINATDLSRIRPDRRAEASRRAASERFENRAAVPGSIGTNISGKAGSGWKRFVSS